MIFVCCSRPLLFAVFQSNYPIHAMGLCLNSLISLNQPAPFYLLMLMLTSSSLPDFFHLFEYCPLIFRSSHASSQCRKGIWVGFTEAGVHELRPLTVNIPSLSVPSMITIPLGNEVGVALATVFCCYLLLFFVSSLECLNFSCDGLCGQVVWLQSQSSHAKIDLIYKIK